MGSGVALAADSAYFVKDVKVDALDQSAVKARNKAFLDAQKKAFMVLAARFKAPEELKTTLPPADNILSGMIQDFEVTNEQLSTKRYRGTYSFRFKIAAANRYFGHGPTNYSNPTDVLAERVLIVPYYKEGKDEPILERAKNRYLTTLKAELPKDGSILLASGDISDMTDVAGKSPEKLTYKAIRRLQARYNVESVVVAMATADLKKPKTVRIDMYRTDKGSVVLSRSYDVPPKQVAMITFQAAVEAPIESGITEAETIETDGTTTDTSSTELPNELSLSTPDVYEDDTALSRPVTAPRPAIAPTPQNQTAQSSSAVVRVFFTGMPEWLAVQRKINGAAGVKGLRITSLKTNQVDAVLTYSNLAMATSSFAAAGMTLQKESENTYILKHKAGY